MSLTLDIFCDCDLCGHYDHYHLLRFVLLLYKFEEIEIIEQCDETWEEETVLYLCYRKRGHRGEHRGEVVSRE